ncbi:MAG: hypothetical protein QF824_00850 [Candidatus Woesearchaeota archaeon]|nr:hypothetical protein [Candidatus Woesearchaeota archaeon]
MEKISKIIKKEANLYNYPNDKTKIFGLYLKNIEEFDEINQKTDTLQQKFNLSSDEILDFLDQKNNLAYIPISIFNNKLAPLEAVVLFLKNTLKFKFQKISYLLNRDQRTIWYTHKKATKKDVKLNISSKILVDISIFGDRKFSILESLVAHLKDSLSLKQIAKLIGKSYKTIWTVDSRYKKKNE